MRLLGQPVPAKEGVDEAPEAATEAPDVDGYAVYVPASDSAPVSEAMPLAAWGNITDPFSLGF